VQYKGEIEKSLRCKLEMEQKVNVFAEILTRAPNQNLLYGNKKT